MKIFSGPVPSPRKAACCTPSLSTSTALTVYFFSAHTCTAAATASPASNAEMRLVFRRPSAPAAAGASAQNARAAAKQETLRIVFIVVPPLALFQLVLDLVDTRARALRVDIVAARTADPDDADDLVARLDQHAALRKHEPR